ncbi:putative catechol oxidase [Helianthus anomalus]
MSSSLLPLNSSLFSVPSTTTQRAKKTRTNPTHGSRVSCNAALDHDHIDNKLILSEPQKLVLPNVDRRNLLVGLSGLYTAANLTSLPEATAKPIETPDIESNCKTEVTSGFNSEDGLTKASRARKCCPPSLGGQITDFKFPTENTVRMRWPSHNGTPEQPNHPDWLNASYVFYDENKKPVRVKNSDSVCLKALRYNYIEECPIENLPWRKCLPAKRNKSEQLESTKDKEPAVDEFKQPVILKKTVEVRVKRPEKKKANETLLISGIKFDCNKFVKFDVFVNDKLKNGVVPTTKDPEYAGGFAQIPHSNGDKMSMSSGARFALKELLEDTNTEDEKYVTVKLVPRVGCEDLTIDEITIINAEP